MPDAYADKIRAPCSVLKRQGRKGARIVVTSPFGDIDDVDRRPNVIDWRVDQRLRLRGAPAEVGGVTALREIVLR